MRVLLKGAGRAAEFIAWNAMRAIECNPGGITGLGARGGRTRVSIGRRRRCPLGHCNAYAQSLAQSSVVRPDRRLVKQ